MRFTIHPEIFERFPALRIPVAIAHGLDNQVDRPLVAARWQAGAPPHIRPWRVRFQALGISSKQFPSSAEALLRRALKGGEPFSINPLVDFYNTISLRHAVPAGGFDLDQLDGPLELRLTRADDRFLALDAEDVVDVPPGEVAYADGQTILTRHFVWRQARAGLIGPTARDVILLSEVLGDLGEAVAQSVLADFQVGLAEQFGVASRTSLLDAGNPAI